MSPRRTTRARCVAVSIAEVFSFPLVTSPRPIVPALALVMLALCSSCVGSPGDGRPLAASPVATSSPTAAPPTAVPTVEPGSLERLACSLPHEWLLRTWRGWRPDRGAEIQILPKEYDFVGSGLPHVGP